MRVCRSGGKLSNQKVCCVSGVFDRCGVCDGTGTTCGSSLGMKVSGAFNDLATGAASGRRLLADNAPAWVAKATGIVKTLVSGALNYPPDQGKRDCDCQRRRPQRDRRAQPPLPLPVQLGPPGLSSTLYCQRSCLLSFLVRMHRIYRRSSESQKR